MPTYWDAHTESAYFAYKVGVDDRRDGFRLKDNPYSKKDFMAAWEKGWKDEDERIKNLYKIS